MIIRLFLAIILIIVISYAVQRFRRQPPAMRRKLAVRLGLYGLAGGVLLLVVTGRAHWLTAVFAGIIPFLSRIIPLAIKVLPFLGQLRKHRVGLGEQPTLHSRFLKLELHQNSGRVGGQVLEGLFAGNSLDDLNQRQLQELLDYYHQADPESFRLLQAYLQQQHRDWTFDYGNRGNDGGAGAAQQSGLSRREAFEILGLEDGASDEEILTAHKKLMQRLHPDRGGSNYLAVKVNQAKDLLIKKRG
jgi:hypothetical protein